MKIKQYNLTVETSGNKWWRNFQSKDGHVRSEHIRHTTLLLMTWTAVRPTYARTDAIRWSTALSTGDLSHENDIIVGWELELLHLIAVLWNRGNCRLLLVSELLQLVKDRISTWNIRVFRVLDALILYPKYSWPFQQISRAGKILHAGNFRAGKVLLEMLEKWNFFFRWILIISEWTRWISP